MLTQESYLGHDELFALQAKIVFGAALIGTETYHTKPTLLTVLSEVDLRQLAGGTRDALRPLGLGRVNINPDGFISPEMRASKKELAAPKEAQPLIRIVLPDTCCWLILVN